MGKQSHSTGVGFMIKCLYVLIFGALENKVDCKFSAQECSDLGFSSQLMCGSCSLLADFKLSVLEQDCLQCCESEADDGSSKFPHATLEICG